MLNSLRRSFGMSPSSSNIQADHMTIGDVPNGVLSPSNRPNTFIPLRRSNSFTNFFSSSRPSSPVKQDMQPNAPTITSPAKASSSGATQEDGDNPVLAFLVLLSKKGKEMQRYPIQSLTTTMGRAEDNDVRILDNLISRHHCSIQIQIEPQQDKDGSNAFLHVLGANGVLLNGTQALPAPRGSGRYDLRTGDKIVVGKRSFVFELPLPSAPQPSASLFLSPVKRGAQSTVPQTPATSNKRRVRMSLVNAAQIDTPARPSSSSSTKLASPAKANNSERESRRANGLQRFMQSANISPSKANKNKSRQSLTSSTSVANMFATPVKSRSAMVEPKTAPPKQVSFSLYSNSYSGRLSPVKQMRMMPPLDTMNEEQDGSFRSENELPEESGSEQATAGEEEQQTDLRNQDDEEDDIVILEEIEQEQEQPALANNSSFTHEDSPAQNMEDAENAENIPPSTPLSTSSASTSPNKSGSPKRAKRRSSFFGRAGPFRGISLGFYAEERSEPEQPAPQTDEHAEEFSDASDVEPTPMEEEQADSESEASPVARRTSKPMMLGISKTPSPVKRQHFADLTPLPRRPRLSLITRRRVSLRTKTLLRSSEAYADRLFLPPPPPTPSTPGPSSLSKSMSMPSNLSAMAPMQPPPAFDSSSSFESDHTQNEEVAKEEQLPEEDFESQLDPALSEEEAEPWKDSEDDEDEVDQSLSVLASSPQKAPVYNFSPVKPSSLPKFATPQPMSKSHARRISMPPVGVADARPSIRSALVRLQISGAGERIVHETAHKSEDAEELPFSQPSSPTKARKVVRVSDVGLPATEVSMGFDLVQDSAVGHESEKIAEALNDLFTAEEEELTDDEMDAEQDEEEEEEEQEEIVQISSKAQESPSRPNAAPATPLQVPQTPAALNSVRHLFSAASAAPATPNMHGLANLLQPSPEKVPQYGTLGDRMRATNPEIVELLSPVKASPKKSTTAPSPSPTKSRRGVRRSQAAELAMPLPATPRAFTSRPEVPFVARPVEPAPAEPAYEAELHVTMFDATAMDAENEAIARAIAQAQEQETAETFELEQAVELEHEAELQQEADLEKTLAEHFAEEAQLEEAVEGEHASVAEAEEDAPVEVTEEATGAGQGVEAEAVVEVAEEDEVASPAGATSVDVSVPGEASQEQAFVEASPLKSRASRRAASSSPVKRAARSASPTKRTVRSSPVKRAPVPVAAPEVFSPEPVVEKPTETMVEIVIESTARTQEESTAQAEQEATEPEPASPSKPTRRAAGRKAKQAATEAISATIMSEASAVASLTEKPARRGKASTEAKKKEMEESPSEEEAVEEAAPKRATRTRATRATATTTTKPVRATRSRAVKAVEALPSSSAGYGDDEASEEEDDVQATPAKTKRAAASRTRGTTATRGKTNRSTKVSVVVVDSSETEDSDELTELEEEEEEQQAPTRTRARTARTKSAPTATTAAKSSRSRAKTAAGREEAASSSSATTTTRSGRTTRSAAAAK